jgi:hypothetical protein
MRPKNAAVLKMRCGSLCGVFELKVAAVQKNGCGLLANVKNAIAVCFAVH